MKLALRLVFWYLLLAGLWILLSDRLLLALVDNASLITTLQSVKGIVFVLLSALLIHTVARNADRSTLSRNLRLGARARVLTALAFLSTAAVGAVVVDLAEQSRVLQKQRAAALSAANQAQRVQSQLERAVSASYALAVLVRQGGGRIGDFDAIANQMLPLYEGVSGLALAPGGVMAQIAPQRVREAALGLNRLVGPDPAGEPPVDVGPRQVTLTGPVDLVRGGLTMAARLPVFLAERDGTERFWGYTITLIALPDFLRAARLQLASANYDYELAQLDAKGRTVFARSGGDPLDDPVTQEFTLANARWSLAVAPAGGWHGRTSLIAEAAMVLGISLLAALLTYVSLRQPALLRRLVQIRTRELAEANGQLKAEIAERRAAEQNVLQLNRLYTVLSQTNQTITRIKDRRELLDTVCGIAVRQGGFRLAWIALREADGPLVASAYAEAVPGSFEGCRTKALETAQTMLMNGTLAISQTAPENPAGDRPGALLALRSQGRTLGVMGLHAGESEPFDARQLDCLHEIAADVSYALDTLGRDAAYQSTQEQLRKLSRAVQQSASSVLITNRDGAIEYVNRKFCETTGYTEQEALGQNPRLLKSDDAAPETYRDLWETILEGREWHGELHNRKKNGELYWALTTISPILNEIGEVTHFVAVSEDVTTRKQAEHHLRLAARVFEGTSEGIMVTDPDGIIQWVNPSFTQITGFSAREAIGQTPRILHSGRHQGDFFREMWETLRELGSWRGEVWNRRKNGDEYSEWLNISALRDDAGRVSNYVAIFSDITRIKATESRLYHMELHDSLTNLPNRQLFHDLLEQALGLAHRHRQTLAVCCLDLDRFKMINDTLGHAVGDQALLAIAGRLSEVLREGDVVARFGGDEFGVILPDLRDQQTASLVARKILDALAQPIELDGQELFLSGSIGIALYPADSTDADSLVKFADAAMYRAKEQGKNTYQFYTLDLNAASFQRLNLESSLRHALERDEFVLHYQPQLDIESGRIVGCEALIRWIHPEMGLVSPGQFIPIAEETGLIVPIGEWALQTACRQNKAWQDAGLPPVRVAVNLSARQFRQHNLAETVSRVLAETALPARSLDLELTESLVMEDAEATVVTLGTLKSMGVNLSIDDFGTGYSSLSYLKRFPIDVLKIDRSFVHDILSDPDDATITVTIIRMAHSLKMRVIAEGVETEGQLDFLRGHGCDEMQGFLFSPAVPAEKFRELLTNQGTPG